MYDIAARCGVWSLSWWWRRHIQLKLEAADEDLGVSTKKKSNDKCASKKQRCRSTSWNSFEPERYCIAYLAAHAYERVPLWKTLQVYTYP